MFLSSHLPSHFTAIVQGGSVVNLDMSFNSMTDNDGVLLLSVLLPESMHGSSMTEQHSGDQHPGGEHDTKCHTLHRLMLDGNDFGERTER